MKLGIFVRLALLGAVLAGAAAAASEDEVYTATMVRTRGLRTQSVHLDLRVRVRATDEDAAALQTILEEEGQEAMLQALRGKDMGEARVTGGLPRRVHWVRVYPGQNASTVIIVTGQPLYFPGEEPEGDPTGALGFITLEMNDRGSGRGRLAEAVGIQVTDDGVLKIEAASPAVIEMENVQREQ